jgi:hypothetical protein
MKTGFTPRTKTTVWKFESVNHRCFMFSHRNERNLEAPDLKEAILNDRPLGEQVPSAPFTVVSLTYMAVLGVAAILLGVFLWMMQ